MKPSFEAMESISADFQTSLTATARRFVDLTNEALALVYYNKDGTRWFFPSELFARQKYWIEQGKLDSYTLAYDAIQGKKNLGKMETVDASA